MVKRRGGSRSICQINASLLLIASWQVISLMSVSKIASQGAAFGEVTVVYRL
jgi:hypothetical protein